MPRASECMGESAQIIKRLLDKETAYRYGGNIYFDPLRFYGFGKLFGLDMSRWPKEKRRFHKDTYPGIQWNYGDFILWHGCEISKKACWDTDIGRGRPSWNIQDPSMVMKYFDGTLSVFCGGIDNLYRHHDYSLAILESIRPFPMARFWMHGAHLFVNGQKMSKSKGNILYTDMLIEKGYRPQEIRFFLLFSHYRERLNYSDRAMKAAAERLRSLRGRISQIKKRADGSRPYHSDFSGKLKETFAGNMDDDLHVKEAVEGMQLVLSSMDSRRLSPSQAAGVIRTLKEIDTVLQVLF